MTFITKTVFTMKGRRQGRRSVKLNAEEWARKDGITDDANQKVRL